MAKVRTIEVSGLASALTALRLPFGKEMRSNVTILSNHGKTGNFAQTCGIFVDKDDLALMKTLIKRGDEHAKVIRGILAYAEVRMPVYWWAECETYRAGHERLCSESTMHIDCKGLTGEALQAAKATIPMGKELTKVDFFSYQCLRNIVKQRHNHRLPEWHDFIEWVHTLPFAEELIFVGL